MEGGWSPKALVPPPPPQMPAARVLLSRSGCSFSAPGSPGGPINLPHVESGM